MWNGSTYLSVQFSPLTDWVVGRLRNEERLSKDPLPVLSAGGPCEQFWHGPGCPLFDIDHGFHFSFLFEKVFCFRENRYKSRVWVSHAGWEKVYSRWKGQRQKKHQVAIPSTCSFNLNINLVWNSTGRLLSIDRCAVSLHGSQRVCLCVRTI